MVQASPQDQKKLLSLQQIDTRVGQLQYEFQHLPLRTELSEARKVLDEVQQRLLDQELQANHIQREVTLASDEVAKVRERITRNNERLEAGGLSRELSALLSENEVLARRQNGLEERELESMQQHEDASAKVAELLGERKKVQQRYDELERQLLVAATEVETQIAEQETEREALAETIESALIQHYEQLRSRYGGVGAAELTGNRCGGCLLELTAYDINEIQSTPADTVAHCDDCGRILVR